MCQWTCCDSIKNSHKSLTSGFTLKTNERRSSPSWSPIFTGKSCFPGSQWCKRIVGPSNPIRESGIGDSGITLGSDLFLSVHRWVGSAPCAVRVKALLPSVEGEPYSEEEFRKQQTMAKLCSSCGWRTGVGAGGRRLPMSQTNQTLGLVFPFPMLQLMLRQSLILHTISVTYNQSRSVLDQTTHQPESLR